MTLPEPIRLLAAILDHAGPMPDEWRDQARACVREAQAPRTMADRITRGENIIGRRVVLPWCIGNPLGTVIHSVADKFGMSCVVQLDDGSVASSKATDTHDEGAERIGPLGHYRDEIGYTEGGDTVDDIRRAKAVLKANAVEAPCAFPGVPGLFIGGEPQFDTAATIIAAQAKELEHLRAQRDQLQRDCSRFEQEARDARKRLLDLARNGAPFMRWRLMSEGEFELADFCKITKHRDGPWDVHFDRQLFVGYPLLAAIDLAESMMVKQNGQATRFDRGAFTSLIRDQ